MRAKSSRASTAVLAVAVLLGVVCTHVAADVHFLAGMECIDCHTAREVMGEG
jgi:hypothetical protein